MVTLVTVKTNEIYTTVANSTVIGSKKICWLGNGACIWSSIQYSVLERCLNRTTIYINTAKLPLIPLPLSTEDSQEMKKCYK